MADLKEEDVIVGAITRVLVLRPAQLPDGFKGQAEAIYRVMKDHMVPWSEHKIAMARIEELESRLSEFEEEPEVTFEQLMLGLNKINPEAERKAKYRVIRGMPSSPGVSDTLYREEN